MNYIILGDSDCPLAEISLENGEVVNIENGAMAYLSNVELTGKLNSKKKGIGGFFSAIGRSIASGESMFITEARGLSDDAVIGIAPQIPGKIRCLEVGGSTQYCLNTSSFLACDEAVNYEMKAQDVSKAILGGTGGLFVMTTYGDGDVLVSAFGDLIELEVSDDRPLVIDNEHVVAWDVNLNYEIRVASGTFGFTTGEGFVNEFHGNGKVLIQTRNIRSLYEALSPYIPKPSNNN